MDEGCRRIPLICGYVFAHVNTTTTPSASILGTLVHMATENDEPRMSKNIDLVHTSASGDQKRYGVFRIVTHIEFRCGLSALD